MGIKLKYNVQQMTWFGCQGSLQELQTGPWPSWDPKQNLMNSVIHNTDRQTETEGIHSLNLFVCFVISQPNTSLWFRAECEMWNEMTHTQKSTQLMNTSVLVNIKALTNDYTIIITVIIILIIHIIMIIITCLMTI